jgi:hypothetical protein
MEHLVSLLQSALGLTAKQGWTWLIAGASVLLLNGYGVGPFAKLDGTWVAIAAVVAVFGAAILLVSFGGYLMDRRAARKKARQRAAGRQSEWDFVNQEAIKNLAILNEHEQAALAWIIRNGQQRFRSDGFHMNGNLLSKHIIYGPIGVTSDVYEVIESVWAIKHELDQRYQDILTYDEPSLG